MTMSDSQQHPTFVWSSINKIYFVSFIIFTFSVSLQKGFDFEQFLLIKTKGESSELNTFKTKKNIFDQIKGIAIFKLQFLYFFLYICFRI